MGRAEAPPALWEQPTLAQHPAPEPKVLKPGAGCSGDRIQDLRGGGHSDGTPLLPSNLTFRNDLRQGPIAKTPQRNEYEREVISARTKAALAAAKAAGPSPAAIARTQPGFPITRPGASRRSRRWPTKLPRSDCRRSLGSRPRSYR